MRRLSLFVVLCIILCLFLPVYAQNSSVEVGEVLYHQDFSAVTDVSDSGVSLGSLTSPDCFISTAGESLDLVTGNNGRLYALLPSIEKSDTYTVEFSFRFSEIRAENGYVAFILTCRGNEPTNISSLVIRANGSVDNFEAPDPALSDLISDRETVNVKIPIKNGALYQIIFSSGGEEYTIERDSVLVIGDGDFGFAVRNASASVNEIYVVNGIDYEELSGYYADESYATDLSPATRHDGDETSPATWDISVTALIAASASFAAICLRKKNITSI